MPISNLVSLRNVLMMALTMLLLTSTAAFAEDSESNQPKKLAAVNSVPFWAHDATGYHPSLCVRIDNVSGSDLTGKMIKMQCRFVDLRLGHVMIARKEQRYELAPNQGVNVIFHGPEPYELPIDQYQWPVVECKLMSRVGDVDDSGTEDLLVQKLDAVTMTDDEAVTALSRGFYQNASVKRGRTKQVHRDSPKPEYKKPEEPMSARALSLAGGGKAQPTAASGETKPALARFSSQAKVPGIGSEFLEFEQMYGHPIGASLRDKGWSWIHYSKQDPPIDVFVGAKGTATKADLIVVKIPAEAVQAESQVVAVAKAMSGKMRGQALEHQHKAVKYQQLSEQKIRRILITNMDSPGYRLCYVTPRGTSGDDNNYILILSRFTGDTPSMIPELIRKAPMMRFLYSALGLPEQD
ncbi:MAG: hypothetical protein HYX67_02245 [Candidatus Melainabacteria bacterium]|nr:hypothetical protein [Candidatus Melainabacteria bacterium]